MKLEQYKMIAQEINQRKMKKAKCILYLCETFNVSEDTLVSIYSQLYQRKIKKSFYKHHRKENISKYYRIYTSSVLTNEKEGFLLRLADDVNFPPSLLARIILEEHYKDSNLFKESGDVSKGFISKCIKNPSDITDKVLMKEVEICVLNDDFCGPIVENIKRQSGIKYEKLLHDFLTERDILYCDEDDLRREGYDKTPDFKLVVPIVVNNHVINWIESKASFGDEESHAGYLENQFWSYANRFGPGLVIYWFGFINELDVNTERGIMLGEKFPSDFITLESLLDEHEENFVLTF